MFPFINRFAGNGLQPKTHTKTIPVGHKRPETLAEQVARLVRSSEFARQVQSQGLETFDEADDFDVPDDHPIPASPWEDNYDLAAVGAMHHGVVASPTPEQVTQSRSVLERVLKAKKGSFQTKVYEDAPPPAPPAENTPKA